MFKANNLRWRTNVVRKGKFSLDDDLAMYIPAFKDMQVLENGVIRKAKNNIKVKHLFTMSSGLDYSVWHEEIKKGKRQLRVSAKRLK